MVLTDGAAHVAELVVAAEGVHTTELRLLSRIKSNAYDTGFSAFRFLIPTSVIMADDRTKHFLDGRDGEFKIFVGEGGRRLVWYPCRAYVLRIRPFDEHTGSP